MTIGAWNCSAAPCRAAIDNMTRARPYRPTRLKNISESWPRASAGAARLAEPG